MNPKAAALLVVLVAGGVCDASSKEAKVRLELPRGSRYREALLTSRVIDNSAVFHAAGGPTTAYDIHLTLWPEGPTILLEGLFGKSELLGDPTVKALANPKLLLKAAADGHALAYSWDNGSTWRGAYLEGASVLLCVHEQISPRAIPATRKVVLGILRAPEAHPKVESRLESMLGGDGRRGELEGALLFAAQHPEDSELLDAMIDRLIAAEVPEERGSLELPQRAGRAARARAAATGRFDALQAARIKTSAEHFWHGFDEGLLDGGFDPAPELAVAVPPPRACKIGPARAGSPPSPLAPGGALAFLGFPKSADAAACAAWKELDGQIDVEVRRELPPRPASPTPMPQAVMNALMQVSMAMASMMSLGPFGSVTPPSAAGQSVLEAYAHEVKACGHVDERDPKCEARVKKAAQAQWDARVEAARQRACLSLEELFAQVKSAVDATQSQPVADPYYAAIAAQSQWSLLNIASKSLGPVSCPPKTPEFPAMP